MSAINCKFSYCNTFAHLKKYRNIYIYFMFFSSNLMEMVFDLYCRLVSSKCDCLLFNNCMGHNLP